MRFRLQNMSLQYLAHHALGKRSRANPLSQCWVWQTGGGRLQQVASHWEVSLSVFTWKRSRRRGPGNFWHFFPPLIWIHYPWWRNTQPLPHTAHMSPDILPDRRRWQDWHSGLRGCWAVISSWNWILYIPPWQYSQTADNYLEATLFGFYFAFWRERLDLFFITDCKLKENKLFFFVVND